MSKTNEIDKEINNLAERMVKSTTDSKQLLFDTIMNLGPEGLKKAAANLSPEDRELLKASLVEMRKAAEVPKKAEEADKLTPKKTETPAKKMETESLSGSDEEDEKLMEDAKANIKHQGGPKDSPLEGQIIKGREVGQEHKTDSGAIIIGHTSTGKPMYANAEHPAHVEHTAQDHKEHAEKHEGLARDIRSRMEPGKPAHKEMYAQARNHEDQAMEHREMAGKKEDKEMEKCYGASMSKSMPEGHPKDCDCAKCDEVKKSFKEVEENARKEGADDPKAVAAAVGIKKYGKEGMEEKAQAGKEKAMKKSEEKEPKKELTPEEKLAKKEMKKAKKIKKSLKKIVRMAKSLKMSKEQVVKAIKDSGNNLKLVKAEMKLQLAKAEGMDSFKPNPEVDQVKMAGQDKKEAGDKEEKPNKEKGDLEIKADETADQALAKLPKMEKSVNWKMKSTIEAGSLGRNTHYEVGAMIEKSEVARTEALKKGGAWFTEAEVDELRKSQVEKADINDLIAKGMDYSTEEIKRIEGVRDHKQDGTIKLQKSFHDKDIAISLGMSEEEYKKLMGE